MTDKKQKSTDDLNVIVPEKGGVVLVDGAEYRVKRIRLIELASFMRVISTGAGPVLMQAGALFDNEEDMTGQITGLVIVALPNAVEEFIDFLNTVLEPVGEVEDGKIVNPDPTAVLDVVALMVEQEKDDWQALMGKARQMWEITVKPLLPTGSQN